MKHFGLFLCTVATLFVLTACNSIVDADAEAALNKKSATFEQLYLFGETSKESVCEFVAVDEGGLSGAIYFTKKGHVIYTENDALIDTVRYYYGTYKMLDSSISFQLTHQFYYPGKWDARWDGQDPDYKKGKSRPFSGEQKLLLKSKCDEEHYFLPYSKSESIAAADRCRMNEVVGLDFFPYHESANEKFYCWFFKQVPVLAEL